ncbi:MAG: preprotein translocase subunit SecA [Chloroflexi bacterium]|nr:preprotein translocase subunit SecA [Chloroflexota bacterium]
MLKWLSNLAGDSNERDLSRLEPVVKAINELEPKFEGLSDEQLKAKTGEFKGRLEGGEALDFLLPEAFAAVREAAKRTLKQRHFDVQLMGGMVLHGGKIAEMKTGEGKTLVATLAVYLNALTGRGVHVVTVNDYLARRDTQWMGPIYHLLGASIACLQHEVAYLFDPDSGAEDPHLQNLTGVGRRQAYEADITYGTNNEFGFDYLRDNMAADLSRTVQREIHYAIVDEVDNILIDEARTPLIISGQAEESTKLYHTFARLVPTLIQEKDYTVDEQHRSVSLTPEGFTKVEKALQIPNLYDPQYYALTHYLDNALRAHAMFKRDGHYVVKDGEAIIVDEFTGRLMAGRRYSDGLHQAIEAKEGLNVQRESITLATITLQNYFRLYEKLAGMTGTAVTEAEEFYKIYKLDVVVIPTHLPMIREEFPDQIYKSEEGKFKALVKDLKELQESGRPVLAGTTSVEKSEQLSQMLTRGGVTHQVLNAKHHEREAGIVAQAGRIGAITVATNMAGRGTDIILGGNPEGRDPDAWAEEHKKVVELGGLHIIGTDRHEARRIDNQLRGRAGRQGDPGSSRFYISVEDDLMRRFGGDRIKTIMNWAGLSDDVPIEHSWISKSVESAQKKVEGFNFDTRKRLVEYDDVTNNHRDVIYTQRRKILEGSDIKANIQEMIEGVISEAVYSYLRDDHGDEWDLEGLLSAIRVLFSLPSDMNEERLAQMHRSEVEDLLLRHAETLYKAQEEKLGEQNMRSIERFVMLRTIDTHWVDHLTAMENMRQSIGLEAFGQRDPLVVYKRQSHEMYEELTTRIRNGIVRTIFHVSLEKKGNGQQPIDGRGKGPEARIAAESSRVVSESKENKDRGRAREKVLAGKVGRNDPCPCGSGKKYKKCHGV